MSRGQFKNVQVIDAALNCTYDVFAVPVRDFKHIFPARGQDVEFVEDFFARNKRVAQRIWKAMWSHRVEKQHLVGLHGTIFCGLEFKKTYYPTKREADDHGLVIVPAEEEARSRVIAALERNRRPAMKTRAKSLRDEAKKWTCNQLAITNHQGEAASLLRKMADTLDQLGEISILDLTYAAAEGPSSQEITMSVYFSFLEGDPP